MRACAACVFLACAACSVHNGAACCRRAKVFLAAAAADSISRRTGQPLARSLSFSRCRRRSRSTRTCQTQVQATRLDLLRRDSTRTNSSRLGVTVAAIGQWLCSLTRFRSGPARLLSPRLLSDAPGRQTTTGIASMAPAAFYSLVGLTCDAGQLAWRRTLSLLLGLSPFAPLAPFFSIFRFRCRYFSAAASSYSPALILDSCRCRT